MVGCVCGAAMTLATRVRYRRDRRRALPTPTRYSSARRSFREKQPNPFKCGRGSLPPEEGLKASIIRAKRPGSARLEQLRVDQVAEAVDHEQVHLLDTARALGRHADLDVAGRERAGDRAAVATGELDDTQSALVRGVD